MRGKISIMIRAMRKGRNGFDVGFGFNDWCFVKRNVPIYLEIS